LQAYKCFDKINIAIRSHGSRNTDTQLKAAQQFHVKEIEQHKFVRVDIQAHQSTILFPQLAASRQQHPVSIHAVFSQI
jgi:hypothetical protein